MPKKTSPDKPDTIMGRPGAGKGKRFTASRSAGSATPATRNNVKSISHLLQRGSLLGKLGQITRQQDEDADWLRQRLPGELAAHVTNVVQKADKLVVLADSAAWCARIKFAVAALQSDVDARAGGPRPIVVRISPPGQAKPAQV